MAGRVAGGKVHFAVRKHGWPFFQADLPFNQTLAFFIEDCYAGFLPGDYGGDPVTGNSFAGELVSIAVVKRPFDPAEGQAPQRPLPEDCRAAWLRKIRINVPVRVRRLPGADGAGIFQGQAGI